MPKNNNKPPVDTTKLFTLPGAVPPPASLRPSQPPTEDTEDESEDHTDYFNQLMSQSSDDIKLPKRPTKQQQASELGIQVYNDDHHASTIFSLSSQERAELRDLIGSPPSEAETSSEVDEDTDIVPPQNIGDVQAVSRAELQRMLDEEKK